MTQDEKEKRKRLASCSKKAVNLARTLRPTDDIFFSTMLQDHPEEAAKMLAILTHRRLEDVLIDKLEIQSFQPSLNGSSAINDLFARLMSGECMLVEMQGRVRGDELERANIYLGRLTSRFVRALKKKKTEGIYDPGYKSLKMNTVIFLSLGDPVGEGQAEYVYDVVNTKTGAVQERLCTRYIFINLLAFLDENDMSDLAKLARDLLRDFSDEYHYDWVRDMIQDALNPYGGFVTMCEKLDLALKKEREETEKAADARRKEEVAAVKAEAEARRAEEVAAVKAEAEARRKEEVAAAKKATKKAAKAKADATRKKTIAELLKLGKNTREEISMVTDTPVSEVNSIALSLGY